jgi:GH15 family glucan-1,4-alpha-glucosidase
MARPIVLSNGELHVGLNNFGLVHDFYFPYVGFENHSAGQDLRHKIGIWVDGAVSWFDEDNGWSFNFSYPHDSLIGHTVAKNERIGIMVELDDCVDSKISAFMRNIHVINLQDRPRDIRLFMHQAFAIGDSRSNTDTGQYLPDSNAILHYRGRRAFIVSGSHNDQPFDQYTIGLFGIENHEGTFRDADDGELSFSNVEHGRVDSTIRFQLNIDAHSSDRVSYWIAAGTSTREALFVHRQVSDDGLAERLSQTADWWGDWLKPARSAADKIAPEHKRLFLTSLMILKSQTDKRGAVIASTDTSMLNYSRDAYAYCWPRDGAYVLWPLIRLGFKDEPYRFFEFCKSVIHPNGHLMHKYRADGAQGSSWHPYIHGKIAAPPNQEDETALVLFVFAQYYQMHPDSSLLKEFYSSMVQPMANFMFEYVDDITGLPKPSYDLWEQTFMTTTYTTSVVYAALIAASELAEMANDPDNAVKWRSAADDIQMAAHKYLYNEERQVFYKGLNVIDDEIVKDSAIDCSAVFGAFMFGLFLPGSDEIRSSIKTTKEVFGINNGAKGLPRYENDDYRRMNSSITGNYWFITTMWLAQYYIESNEPAKAMEILDWVKSSALSTGMMSEQIDPISGTIISPAPLSWTHAEYITTLLDTITERA